MSKLSNPHFVFILILLNINFLSFTQSQSCLSFDGQNDQVTIPAAVGQSLGANHFTLEAWVTGNESDISHGTILSNRTGADSGLHLAIHSYWGGSDHKMLMFRYNGINWLHINNGSFNGKILDGTCHHVAVTRDETGLSFYVDGNLIGSNNITVDIDLNTNMPIWVGADPQSNSPFAGNISDVRIWKVARTAAELQEGMANGVDPNSANLIGSWAMNEGTGQTVSDLTNQNNALLGSTDSNEDSDPSWESDCCSFTPAPTGDCLTFDGQNDQVTIPAAVGQSLGANHFTLEAWVTGNESDISHGTILSNRTGADSGLHLAIHSYWGGSDHKMLMFRYNGINWLHINNGSFNGKILDGTCHHVAVTRDETGLSFYVDGNLIGSNNITVDIDLNTNMPIWVGADPQSNSPFAGNISDVRIWKVARTAAELQEGMANGVDPNSANLIGSWAMNEGTGQTVSDLTNQNNALLGSTDSNEDSDPSWESDCCSFTPAPTGDCLTFDGQNDQVTIPAAVGQSLGANHFTLEAWVTGNESDISHGTILSNRTGADSGLHLAIHSYWGGSDHKMLMFRYNGINWLHINNGSFNGKILDGTCHHVAVTRDETGLSFYVDGNLIGSNNITVDIDLNTNMPIWVGADPQSNSPFAGNISDVRIWKVARTAAELQEGMANGVDPNSANLIGSWAMNEGTGQTVSDLTNQNDALLGSTDSNEDSDPSWESDCCSFTPAPTGDCLTFDGQNDQVTIPAAVGQSLGANHFTLEAWVTGNESDISHGTILSNRTGADSGLHLAIHSYWGGSDHKMLMFRYNGINWLHINNGSFNGKILDGTCHHVAVTRDETGLSFYVDGNHIGSNNMTVDIDLNTDMPIRVGADPQSNSPFAGNISDVRIWKVARTAAELQEGMANGVDPNSTNLIGSWAMNEGTGQTVSDLTNQNDALLGSTDSNEDSDPSWESDCCSFTPAPTGDCLTFDGQNDQVTIPAAVGQSLGANHFTLEAWVTGNESDISHGTILSNRTGADSGLHLAIHSYWGGSDHKMLMFRYNGINWLHINNGSFNGKILDGTCHHVAVTRDETGLSFYVDGNLIGSNNMTVDIDLNTDMPIWVGADPQSNSPFAGNIGDVRIWSVARTEAELQEGMANGVDPNTAGLLGYWEMNEGTGQIIPDLTNQNNALLGSTDSEENSDPTWGNECCFSPVVIISTDNFEKESQALMLSVYPNPSTGLFHIYFDGGFEKDKFTFSVYNVLGSIVDEGVLLESTIDLQKLPSGQYWLKVADETGNVGVAKVLILK